MDAGQSYIYFIRYLKHLGYDSDASVGHIQCWCKGDECVVFSSESDLMPSNRLIELLTDIRKELKDYIPFLESLKSELELLHKENGKASE